MIIEIADLDSPIGRINLAVRDGLLCGLEFAAGWSRPRKPLEKRYPESTVRKVSDPAGIVTRLRRYLAGDIDALTEIGVEPAGTPFQRRVWSALRRIPPGETLSYKALAESIGEPTAVRAVGAANGANPIGIVIPCHRVIGADGSLTGYAGGLDRKRWLLAHEHRA